MQALAVTFHPRRKGQGESVLVARVLFDGPNATVVPFEAPRSRIRPFDPEALLAKLRFLVSTAGDRPREALLKLSSEFWSFEEVTP